MGEFCLRTTPKLASIVWTYVCGETSWFVRLQVVSAPCWLGTAPSVLAESEEQINFFQHSAKILFKMTSESFESCLVIVLGPFLKISRWVPLNLACKQRTSGQIFAMQMSNHDVPFAIRGCPARRCMVFVLSVLNRVYNFV